MPKLRKEGVVQPPAVSLRLDAESLQFYRRRAQAAGRALSPYLAILLKEGVVAENAVELEKKFGAVADRIEGIAAKVQVGLPDEVLLAIFGIEAMLTSIVEKRDTQELYSAQNTAQRKLLALKGARRG